MFLSGGRGAVPPPAPAWRRHWTRRWCTCKPLIRSIYGKYSRNPQKLLLKVSQLILVGFSVLFNILKVYQSRNPGKVFFFKTASKMAAVTS